MLIIRKFLSKDWGQIPNYFWENYVFIVWSTYTYALDILIWVNQKLTTIDSRYTRIEYNSELNIKR